ncbi:hypothetical protein NHG28_06420 [Aerococcaceae bacterium NML201209]|nr:hypothetical protein [Aerococcaceae bacterium NML201209]MCW6666973.1 hypothetical protein [Aerococcaceae bacterium NML190938]
MNIETIITVVSVGVAGFAIGRMWTQKQMQDLLYDVLNEVDKMTKGE